MFPDQPPRPCVLIVEDEADLLAMLEALIRGAGYDTMSAGNGVDALTQMRLRRPCVVLLDLIMPVMDGFEFRAHQLREPALAGVPVVCLSGACHSSQVWHRIGLPCLQKPVTGQRVLSAVKPYCCGQE